MKQRLRSALRSHRSAGPRSRPSEPGPCYYCQRQRSLFTIYLAPVTTSTIYCQRFFTSAAFLASRSARALACPSFMYAMRFAFISSFCLLFSASRSAAFSRMFFCHSIKSSEVSLVRASLAASLRCRSMSSRRSHSPRCSEYSSCSSPCFLLFYDCAGSTEA